MKNILAFIIAFIIVIGLILGVAYFGLSKYNFLPWQQRPYSEVVFNKSNPIDPNGQITIIETDKSPEELSFQVGAESSHGRETVVANYFSDLQKPRFMTLSPYGDIIVSDIKSDAVYAIIDKDKDFKGDTKVTIISNLNNPHGVLMRNGDLYIAETDKVRVLRGLTESYTYTSNDIIIDGISDASGHFTRSLVIKDNKLYVSVGSSCNACVERNENRATILRFDLDGTNKETYATGLRNTVGFVSSPFDGLLYGIDNGRDWLGDYLPPEELNIIQRGDYGWPYCYGQQIRDESVQGDVDCKQTIAPLWEMQSHVAPLGLRFYNGDMFPEFSGDLLIAQHGSWDSAMPVGYKVVRIDFDENNKPVQELNMLDIFLRGDTVKGRPVDILVGEQGEIYITDDFAGRIYVMYKQ